MIGHSSRLSVSCLGLAAVLLFPCGVLRAGNSSQVILEFAASADYDLNFKEPSLYHDIQQDPHGYLQLSGQTTGIAVYDRSASGGAKGQGGTDGLDANRQFTDGTISAKVSSSTANGLGAALLFRLDSSETKGYLARVHAISSTQIVFEIYEGAGVSGSGIRIFETKQDLAGLVLQAGQFYTYTVSLQGGTFVLDFAEGAAQATFTDETVSATAGQIGFVLDTPRQSEATRLKSLSILSTAREERLAMK